MATKDHWLLYPDIEAAGRLGPAVEAEFTLMGIDLDVHGFGTGGWATVTSGSRTSQMSIALEKRLFMPDFWSRGVALGSASTPDFADAVNAIAIWLTEDISITDMENRYPFVKVSDGARAFLVGRGVDYAWGKIDEWVTEDLPRLIPLIEAARRRPQLRQLLPFTSHASLHFSRCAAYPYTHDVAHAIVIREGHYRALGPGFVVVERTFKGPLHKEGDYDIRDHYKEAVYDILGDGNAEHVIDLIVDTLPPGCGPAIQGTAADMKNDNEVSFGG